jgi:putative transposase
MSRKYKMDNSNGLYFLTMTTVEWADLFTRVEYKEVLIESLKYCCKEKGLILHAYVIMSNHIHLIISRQEDGKIFPSIIRDFKKFTAFCLLKRIKNSLTESRKEWMLEIFQRNGSKNSNNSCYQFWQQHNQPIILYTRKVILQKIDYIHQNPVKQGLVFNSTDYVYSSAGSYAGFETEARLPIILLDDYYSF